jgi:hypothetical protein
MILLRGAECCAKRSIEKVGKFSAKIPFVAVDYRAHRPSWMVFVDINSPHSALRGDEPVLR